MTMAVVCANNGQFQGACEQLDLRAQGALPGALWVEIAHEVRLQVVGPRERLEQVVPPADLGAPVAHGGSGWTAPAARRLLAELESLLLHADRNVREAAVDAVVQVAAKGDREALQCLMVCFADADAMVRAVALEAAEMLLDSSLSSVLLVHEVLRGVCQGARPGFAGRVLLVEYRTMLIPATACAHRRRQARCDSAPLCHRS